MMKARTLSRVVRTINFHQKIAPFKVHGSPGTGQKRRIGPNVVVDMDKVVSFCYVLQPL
jgi:hypothetical protein